MVVRPEQPLSPEQIVVRDGYLLLRDSLHAIDAATARLQRDMRSTSDITLAERAKAVRDACTRSSRTLPAAKEAVLSMVARVPAGRAATLRRKFDSLATTLAGCTSEFGGWTTPDKGGAIRGYGVNRALAVQAVLRDYDHEATNYLRIIGIKVRTPAGSPSPAPGAD